jgi:hypothetical protein
MLRLAVPFDKDCGRDFDVTAQLVCGMAAQEETIEKGRFTLREVEILYDFDGNELWHRGHGEKCSLPKSVAASSRTTVFMPRSG